MPKKPPSNLSKPKFAKKNCLQRVANKPMKSLVKPTKKPVLCSRQLKKRLLKTAKMIEDAHNKIEADVKKAKANLQSEVKSLVAQATEAILDEKIDQKKDAALIEKAIKEAS